MIQPPWIKQGIEAGRGLEISRLSPLTHNLINLSVFSFLLLAIAGIYYLHWKLPFAIYIPIASLLLGYISLTLFVLVIHEASHNMFLVTRRRKSTYRLNRSFGWAVSILYGVDYRRHWEEGHITHHLNPMAEQDPQICNPRTGHELFKHGLKCLLIPGYIQFLGILRGGGVEFDCPPVKRYPNRLWSYLIMNLIWVPFILFSILFISRSSWSFIVAWILSIQILSFLTFLKTAVEHGGGLAQEPNPYLRQRTSLFLASWLFLPANIRYHFEHHLNYRVPWYNLPRYHRELIRIIPKNLHSYCFNQHFWSQVKGENPLIAPEARLELGI